ncbi:hypothetical protein CEY04_16275 [Achromobacter sp. HZ28]|nr:hypothetical protein CEY04_16275 [Achromobacter sp. HZ28]OWT78379.1 hypothetical protein CEY05_10770 [Achromobacter sp. HZ34]
MRVPVVTPRWVAVAESALRWLGGAAAACALVWLGLPAGLAWPLALAAILASLPATGLRRAAAVRALLFTADHALYIRGGRGTGRVSGQETRHVWRPLTLTAATRGWRCLALQGDLPASLSPRLGPFKARRVSFTIWQDALPAAAWRRLNLSCQRRLRRVGTA